MDLGTAQLKSILSLYYWENIKGLGARVIPKTFDVLDMPLYTSCTQGPTMARPGVEFSSFEVSKCLENGLFKLPIVHQVQAIVVYLILEV